MVGPTVYTRKDCRLCESNDLEIALPMKPSPIGDAYITESQLSDIQPAYPLSLYRCRQCSHIQLPTVIDPQFLFSNYIYQTATSPGLVNHFKCYADTVLEKVSCPKNSFIVEIGSNDGSLLKFFKDQGMRVLGVDPAQAIAEKATQVGLETLPVFFNFEVAKQICQDYGHATIITANNVFAHSDHLRDMAKGIQHLLAPEGVFVFEVSYLVDILNKKLFDTIYHEHLSYHHVAALERFLQLYGMTLFAVEHLSSKGGSIRCFAKLKTSNRQVESSINALLMLEQAMGIEKIDTYRRLEHEIKQIKDNLLAMLHELKIKGKKIVGYGASPTVTTLMYQLELNDYVSFLVDDNPIKQGRYSPGHHLPVLSSQKIYEEKPDYIIILAWPYAEMIVKKHQHYIDHGGCFIIPLPTLKCITEKDFAYAENAR